MIKISIKSDIKKAIKALDDLQRKQVPFATAKALTDTAKAVQKAVIAQAEKDLDNPMPFTKRGFYVQRATKANLIAVVGIKDIQDKYLRTQIFGGTSKPNKRALLKPKNVALNAYGNLPRNRVKRLLARADVFSGTVAGIDGIWQRLGKDGKAKRNVKLLIRYKKEQRYKPQYKFYETAEKVARSSFRRNFDNALAEALRSAR